MHLGNLRRVSFLLPPTMLSLTEPRLRSMPSVTLEAAASAPLTGLAATPTTPCAMPAAGRQGIYLDESLQYCITGGTGTLYRKLF